MCVSSAHVMVGSFLRCSQVVLLGMMRLSCGSQILWSRSLA